VARLERAASFIQHNMPLGQGGTLSWQDAFDLSAYIGGCAAYDEGS
jgi:thiosulfate dehydrogenase